MIVFEDSTHLFNTEEKEILEKKCRSFVNDDVPSADTKNYYVRERINKNNDEFKTIISKVNNHITNLSKTESIKLDGFWINKITNETNQNDGFHKDVSDITFLMYLNDEFTGGEYEYIVPETKNKEHLIPKKYLSIITTKDVAHRVKPVINGERYSIVFFYNFDKKISKTLI